MRRSGTVRERFETSVSTLVTLAAARSLETGRPEAVVERVAEKQPE